MSLQAYIDQRNRFASLFKTKPLEMPKTPEERKHLRNLLEGDLSPENLTCDGELSHAAVVQKARLFNAALRDLEQLDRGQPIAPVAGATDPKDVERINKMYHELQPIMERLFSRWLDEKEYEDVNDYRMPIEATVAKHGMTLVRMTKRPFGFEFKVGTNAVYQIGINRSQYYWKRNK